MPDVFVMGMREHGKSLHFQMEQQRQLPKSSYTRDLVRWVRLKKYQYEVTLSLYMLTPVEKFVFNLCLCTLVLMMCAAVYFYLPNHVAIISSRVYYYMVGEWGNMSMSAGNTVSAVTQLVRRTAAPAANGDARPILPPDEL